MITADDGFTGMQRLSWQGFLKEVSTNVECLWHENGASPYWNACQQAGVDALFCLAIFWHESNYGTRGVATITKSPGNLRNPPVGDVPFTRYQYPGKGWYLAFASWSDGWRAMVAHLASPLYAGLSIHEALHKWAPLGDGANDPNAYTTAVVDFMNAKGDTGGGGNMAAPTQDDIGYPVTIDLVGTRGPARALGAVEWFVVHDGEGSYGSVVSTLSNNPNASAHAVIAHDGRLTYMVPIEYTAWHPGNDAVAVASIGVEQEGYADGHDGGYTSDQYRSMAAFFRWCVTQGAAVPAEYIGRRDADGGPLPDVPGIIGHSDVPNPNVPGAWGGVSGHTDPGPLYDWQQLIADIGGASPQPLPTEFFQPNNPYGAVPIRPPFWNRFNFLESVRPGLGYATMGYARRAEQTTGSRRVQEFQRGWYAADPSQSDPWDCVAMLTTEFPTQ